MPLFVTSLKPLFINPYFSAISLILLKKYFIISLSAFDTKSLKLLESLNAPAYKIASLESLHFPLIEKVCKTNKPILISTGTLNLFSYNLFG